MPCRFDAERYTILDAWDDMLDGKGGNATMTKTPRVSEHDEQVALMKMCKLHTKKYPELALLHAVPNGGARHPAVAAKLKAEGVKAGVPDLFLPAPRQTQTGWVHGLYIELKARGGRVSEAQAEMMDALSRQGYACIVAYGWEGAWKEIHAYLASDKIATLREVFGDAR